MSAEPASRRTRLGQEERRGQILERARELFSTQHYGAVSVEAVAREAGVTPGLVHHYFGTKRGLYLEVVREMLAGGAPPVPEEASALSVHERLAESVDRWLDRVWRNRETWLASLGVEGLGRDPEVELMLERVREAAADNVIELLDLGPPPDASPALKAVIRSYAGLAEAASREWLVRERLTRAQIHALLHASLLRLVEDVLPLLEDADAQGDPA